jgi:hypothetical protein
LKGCAVKNVGAAILGLLPVTGGFPGAGEWPFGFEINWVFMVTSFGLCGMAVRVGHDSYAFGYGKDGRIFQKM